MSGILRTRRVCAGIATKRKLNHILAIFGRGRPRIIQVNPTDHKLPYYHNKYKRIISTFGSNAKNLVVLSLFPKRSLMQQIIVAVLGTVSSTYQSLCFQILVADKI